MNFDNVYCYPISQNSLLLYQKLTNNNLINCQKHFQNISINDIIENTTISALAITN